MSTITTNRLSRFIIAAFVLVVGACGNPESSSTINLDSIQHDSLRKDSLRLDSLRLDSIAHIPPTFPDSSFIPKGFKIKDAVFGNLNLDAFTDAIVVLQRDDEEWMDERARPVLILTGDSSGNYKVVFRGDNITPPRAAGQMAGEPYNGIEIDSGTFRINHYGGSRFRWTTDYVFEYDTAKRTWFYIKSFASVGDMAGEMNDLDSTGQCIPYDYDTLILRKKIDIQKFDLDGAPVAELEW